LPPISPPRRRSPRRRGHHRWPPLAAAGPRRRPPPSLPSGPLPPLGELVVQPGRLPGRDRRRLAGLAGPAPPLPGQGPNCSD
jgi:hypothetical protein